MINKKYELEGLIMYYDMDPYMGKYDFIYFWQPLYQYGKISASCLSQWYPSVFSVDGQLYQNAEQYMMAEKARLFDDEDTRKLILASTNPSEIKKLGRKVKNFDDGVWKEHCDSVVLKGNIQKFYQNRNLSEYLISTGRKILVEASPYDKIWGIGMNQAEAFECTPHEWRGKNKLGFILMEARDILREKIERRNEYKDYLFFHGEENNMFENNSDEAYFFHLEKRHFETSKYEMNHICILCDIFKHDYEHLYRCCQNETTWEIVSMALEDIHETRYYDQDKYEKLLGRYVRLGALKYCRYYKGETDCPFDIGTSQAHFWYFEEQYWMDSSFDHIQFEEKAIDYIQKHPNCTNFLTSDAPIEQKGFVLFAEAMLEKWCPQDVNLIFEY